MFQKWPYCRGFQESVLCNDSTKASRSPIRLLTEKEQKKLPQKVGSFYTDSLVKEQKDTFFSFKTPECDSRREAVLPDVSTG